MNIDKALISNNVFHSEESTTMHITTSMPIPRQWPSSVKSAFIHAVSMASAVFTCSCVLSAKRKSRDTRQNAELAQAYQENQLL